jgi:ZIP family zinc transporter
VLEALVAGLVAGSSLLLGGAIALARPQSSRTVGLVMAFGSGVLISAVAYDLILEAAEVSGGAGIPLGAALGAIAYYAGDRMIEGAGGGDRKRVRQAGEASGSPKAVVLGTVLDGIPESTVIGLTVLAGDGVSLALLAAVFLSNVPEAIAATTGLSASGVPARTIMLTWAGIVAIGGLSAWLGYAVLGGASPRTIAVVMAFAAGAVLTMLADTMMPEAFAEGGRRAGLATTLGFVVAIAIAQAERLS